MKNKKKLLHFKVEVCLAFVIATSILFYGCSQDKPEFGLRCKISGKDIPVKLVDNSGETDNKMFSNGLEREKADGINNAEVGQEVFLEFPRDFPDTIEIQEFLLNSATGDLLYDDFGKKDILYTVKEKNIVFILEENVGTYASSNPPKTDLRGYKVRVIRNQQEYIYFFYVQTKSTFY